MKLEKHSIYLVGHLTQAQKKELSNQLGGGDYSYDALRGLLAGDRRISSFNTNGGSPEINGFMDWGNEGDLRWYEDQLRKGNNFYNLKNIFKVEVEGEFVSVHNINQEQEEKVRWLR